MRSKVLQAILLISAGLGAAIYMVRLVWDGLDDGGVTPILPALLALMAASVAFITWGTASFLGRKRKPEDAPARPHGDYRHTYALFGAIGGLLLVAVVVRYFAVPPTFGQFGFYRGAAAAEARDRQPRHVGQETCAMCHADVVEAHDKDLHASVPCESCHGPGWKHAEAGGTEPLFKATRGKEFRALCLTCHLRQPARPGDFAQINWSEHVKNVGARDASVDCKSCHDPHEPLYLDGDLRTALRHPLVPRDFYGDPSHEDLQASLSAGPPKPSECAFCHQTLVSDFASRTHKQQRCTNCHAFVKEADTYGRMVKNRDSHLCLRCHRGGDFRAKDAAAPSIAWPGHATSKGVSGEKARCVDCHQQDIHGPRKARGTEHANG